MKHFSLKYPIYLLCFIMLIGLIMPDHASLDADSGSGYPPVISQIIQLDKDNGRDAADSAMLISAASTASFHIPAVLRQQVYAYLQPDPLPALRPPILSA